MKLSGLSILGQTRVKAAGEPKAAVNPATDAAIGPDYFWTTSADVDAAADLAAKAFIEFRRWSGQQRQALLHRLAQLLEANGGAIIERANLETALPVKFAETIRAALGRDPERPAEFVGLEKLPQRFRVIPNDAGALKRIIEQA